MLVTAVCPTANRPDYLKKAIACFFSQTFTDSELLILDDGLEPCSKDIPICPRVHYECRPPNTWKTLGEKRNALNFLARGEIIWHLDDDDWSAPERMEEQVHFLNNSGAQATGYSSLLFYRVVDGGLFKYQFGGTGHYAVGTSLCYRYDYWKRNPFPTMNVGEDSQFALKAAANKDLISVHGLGKMVARTLPTSTAKPNLGDFNFPMALRAEFPEAFLEVA